MALESILIKFLVTITIIFFLPKIINRYYKIPSPLIEIILGILLGIFIPTYFFVDDAIHVLATLGIITLFVYSGMEVDLRFLNKHKLFFVENASRHLLVFAIIFAIIQTTFSLTTQVSLIVAVALTTPSAGYIISSFDKRDKRKKAIEGKAIVGEILGILLLIIAINLSYPEKLILTIFSLILIIFLIPLVLKWLYERVFVKLIGTEFSFIFIVALIAAFFTEYLGLHFLVGAFIAGVISRRFISKVKMNGRINTSKKISDSFGFFAITFIPFYFFSVGLTMDASFFSTKPILIALGLCLGVSALRILSLLIHRKLRNKESIKKAFPYSYPLMPTVVFTFVIAQILYKEFALSQELYSALMLYGIATPLLSLILFFINQKVSSKVQN